MLRLIIFFFRYKAELKHTQKRERTDWETERGRNREIEKREIRRQNNYSNNECTVQLCIIRHYNLSTVNHTPEHAYTAKVISIRRRQCAVGIEKLMRSEKKRLSVAFFSLFFRFFSFLPHTRIPFLVSLTIIVRSASVFLICSFAFFYLLVSSGSSSRIWICFEVSVICWHPL